MSDFHAAWANENQKAVEKEREARVWVGIDAGTWPSAVALLHADGSYEILDGTPVEPLEAPMGQGMSHDRQDTDETGSDTNPCKPDCP